MSSSTMVVTRRSALETETKKDQDEDEKSDKYESPKYEKPIQNDHVKSTPNNVNKYGLTRRKIFIRVGLCSMIIFLVYSQSTNIKPKVFASQKETIQFRSHEVPCSKDYQEELSKFPSCVPVRCGRVITDELLTPHENFELLRLAKKGIALGGAFGGVSILDVHSGALSQGDQFVNVYKIIKQNQIKNVFTHKSFEIYRAVKNKIQRMVALHFGLRAKNIYLTHPTFFSRMMDIPARTLHDEYWHVHVDKVTYDSFHYTSLVYLSDYDVDFQGGQFNFIDKESNMTVEPKVGRVMAFTSGSENPHHVAKVEGGTRWALTVSFTCDKSKAISSPTVAKLK